MVINGIGGGTGISGISSAFAAPGAKDAKAASGKEGGFTQILGDMVKNVNDMQVKADHAVQDFVTGQSKGLHEVMLAVEKSSISFQFLNQVRNKAVGAYQEIMRMQV
jgi:flagellar hook-basal body complex protein FliE